MRRRVVRALRVGLLMLGALLLAWIPLSYFLYVEWTSPWPINISFDLSSGTVVAVFSTHNPYWRFEFQGAIGWPYENGETALLPAFERISNNVWTERRFTLPLWLLAALCLAWPVTSFLVARRRRRGRGFEVEARDGSAVSMADS